MNKDNLKQLSRNLEYNPDNYMDCFRSNIRMYLENKTFKLQELADAAEINCDSLKNFLYGNSKDCYLSTAVKLARVFGVSVDELVGCGTLTPQMCESIQITRNMPDNFVYFVRWGIRHHERELNKINFKTKAINIMLPECNSKGLIKMTNDFEILDISDINSEDRSKIYMGIRIPSDNYMPKYSPYDILLIANDRPARSSEHEVVFSSGSIWILQRKIENGKIKYFSIRDGKFRANEEDIDEVLGYIVDVRR